MRKADNFSDVCMQTDSCALAGAAAFFAGVPDAAIVVNGPMWCYFYAMRHLEYNLPLLSERMSCTQLDNNAIVFGAEEYLKETLEPYIKEPPKLLCIETNCSGSLIGDDNAGIARTMGIECPIVVFDSGGLTGGFSEGYVKAGKNVFETLFLTAKIEKSKTDMSKKRVNLLGLTTGYYNGINDRRELVRLLQLAGYEINACPGDGASYEDLLNIGNASLNIVVHHELGCELAKLLKERLDIPYVAPLPPYGTEGTKKWLKEIDAVLSAPKLEQVMNEIERVQKRLFLRLNDFKSIWGELWFDEVIVAAPPSIAIATAEALRGEWADMGRLSVVANESISADATNIDDCYVIGRDDKAIEDRYHEIERGLLMGSSNENSLLHRYGKNLQTFPIAYPVFGQVLLTDLPYMGLRGAEYIQQCLWNEYVKGKNKRS